jgi:hypothetical protein
MVLIIDDNEFNDGDAGNDDARRGDHRGRYSPEHIQDPPKQAGSVH